MTLVEAPNYRLYQHWLMMQPEAERASYKYVKDVHDLISAYGPVIVLNGGSEDPHVRNLVKHPSRYGNCTHVEV